ncbi:hypothetical protein COCNU_07G007020 [Cocos nucifera]|uniref:Secreted protein n=1 Tax=Cocos nucifera TaxID=13894 RepID=A0A8K0N4C3_COCNU|nr:hypothetical protein COCNU_07G007020 [Cocos nucifera]
MSATFIVFVCARLICGRVRSVDSRDVAFDLDLHSDLEASEHAISGLEPVVVAAIPTMKFKHRLEILLNLVQPPKRRCQGST